MQIFAINEHGLALFLSLTDQTNRAWVDMGRTKLLDLWASDYSRPEWSFLVEENGIIVGRVAYRHHGLPREIWPIELELPWQANYLVVGTALFGDSLQAMAEQGAQRVVAQVSSPWATANAQRQVYEGAGFRLHQAKSSFVFTMPTTPVIVPDRLTYHTLAEVGEAVFIDAVQRASVQTLDREDQMAIAQVGLQQMAANYFTLLQNEHWAYHPNWWQVAYAADGTLVGFVQPLLFRATPQTGTIGYIGVVPEQRGHRYVDDLLAKAQRILQEAAVLDMYCDTDSENFPMIGAFQRAGYQDNGTNWTYQMDLM